MLEVVSVSEAKNRFAEIIRESSEHDRVYRVGNARRRHAKTSLILGEGVVQYLLGDRRCSVEWEHDAEQDLWTVYVPELDVFGEGKSRDQAEATLIEAVWEYVDLYLEEITFYTKLGRGHHLPYILALAMRKEDADASRHLLGL